LNLKNVYKITQETLAQRSSFDASLITLYFQKRSVYILSFKIILSKL